MTGRKECKGLELSTLSKVLLLILPLVVAVLALCIGRLGISPAEVIRSIFGKITGNADLESKNELVLWNIRMPRIILAALVGAGLSVSGCTFQSLFPILLPRPIQSEFQAEPASERLLRFFSGLILLSLRQLLFVWNYCRVADLSRRQR